MSIRIRDFEVAAMSEMDSERRVEHLTKRISQPQKDLWISLGKRIENAFNEIAKPVHTHPARPLHQFSQPFDPMTTELHPDEHGCGPVREMALVLDYQQVGRKRVVIA